MFSLEHVSYIILTDFLITYLFKSGLPRSVRRSAKYDRVSKIISLLNLCFCYNVRVTVTETRYYIMQYLLPNCQIFEKKYN